MKVPNPVTFGIAVGKLVTALVKGRNPIASAAKVDFRLAQCAVCPFFDGGLRQCNLCSCFVDLKANLATETCPAGNWGVSQLTKVRVIKSLQKLWKVTHRGLKRAIRLGQSALPTCLLP